MGQQNMLARLLRGNPDPSLPGYPVMQSSKDGGFAPMPRSFGDAGQRMAAVLRGDVEPTPEEGRQIATVRGFTEGPASIRAFHGSPHRFERFDMSRAGTTTDDGHLGRALYFTTDAETAMKEPFAGPGTKWPNRYEVNLDVKNPLELQRQSWFDDKKQMVRRALGLSDTATAEQVRDEAMKRGHDAVRLDNVPLGYNAQEIAVFDDKLIEILRRYGVAGTLGGGAAATAGTSE
jgi:hypothetical protein